MALITFAAFYIQLAPVSLKTWVFAKSKRIFWIANRVPALKVPAGFVRKLGAVEPHRGSEPIDPMDTR
jgi:hypothetical protein